MAAKTYDKKHSVETLIDVDYITRDEKPVIRLFHKQEDSSRTIKEVTDFRPYFYAIPSSDTGALSKDLKALDGVVDVEARMMLDLNRGVDVLKVYVKQPKDVPHLREEAAGLESCRNIREADIPFARRYLIDSGLTPMEDCEKFSLKIAAFDMEVYNPRGEPNSKKDPIIMISYADSLGLEKVYTYGKDEKQMPKYVEVLRDEAETIKRFVETVKDRGIDIIVSYNGDNFDFPYLKDRAEKLKVAIGLGIDGSEVRLERRGMNLGADVKGRPHVDLFPISRQVFHLPRYRLEDVYQEIFGQEKKDLINASDISKYWDSGKKEDLEKLLKYSLSDVVSTLKIGLALLPLQYELSRVIRQPIYECSRMGSSQRVEILLIENAFRKNMLVPNKPSEQDVGVRKDETYVGAYVVEPAKGIHDNIVLFDFRSLYPSIIISHNIDLTTIDCECCPKDGFKAPNNHHFCRKKKGFIPEIIETLLSKRIDAKKRFKEETDPEKKRMLDVKQQALKILANSMYGYYGFPMARWYCRECAEAITALGRDYIQKTIADAGGHGFKVIYGDTDSVYLTLPDESDREGIIKKALEFQKGINDKLPGDMELEFDGFYPRGIFITKKRYAIMDEKGKLIVKGLETKRRDWANIAKDTQEGVLNALLKDRNPEKAVEIVKKAVSDIRGGKVTLKDLAINTQITRGMGEYVQDGPHVVAAKKAMREGMDFKQGDIITYVVTKKGNSISDRSKIIDFVGEGDYDPDYYINNQVIPAVLRILEALGYSEDELKGLGKQMTLGSF